MLFAPYAPQAHGSSVDALVRPAATADLQACALLSQNRNGGELDTWFGRLAVDLEDPEAKLLVAEVDRRVAGHAVARWLSFDHRLARNLTDGWYLTGLLVDPRHRRAGLGRRLVQARLDWLAPRAASVWYFAAATNPASIALHEPFGFTEVTRDFVVPGVTFRGGEGVLFRRATPGFAGPSE
jgi:Acetyltransferases